jgi:hypothetical protein
MRFGAFVFAEIGAVLCGVVASAGVSVGGAAGVAGAFGASAAGFAAAGSGVAGGFGLGVDELVEVAAGASGSLLLIHEGEAVLVKFGEEVLPINLFQRVVVAVLRFGKAEAQDTGFSVLFSAGDLAGDGVPCLCPPADLVVVLGGFR